MAANMNKWVRYALFALLWGAVLAYIVYAGTASRAKVAQKTISRVQIRVEDSTAHGHLVSVPVVHEWIARSGIGTVGTSVDATRLSQIEQLIARNGFVERVNAYVDYVGVLYIDVRAHEPLVRLLVDGMNAYMTAEGHVFAAPRASALYVPVVTGSYRPPFEASYGGSVRSRIDAELAAIEQRINELEDEKYPFYTRERRNGNNYAALRRMRVRRQWWRFESAAAFDARVEQLRSEKDELRRKYRYETRLIQEGIDHIDIQQQTERQRQKKLEKSYEDLMKLVTFVKILEEDTFWRSEVVQIVARTAPGGALDIELVPRSGAYTIRLGRLERVEKKLDKLLRFYRNGLARIGWDAYKTIDISYNDRVVCKR